MMCTNLPTDTLDGAYERQQLPSKLASWAKATHKSQGLTLKRAWIDIGKSARTPGMFCAAMSRLRTLASCVIEPMTFQRLTSLKKSVGRLNKLAKTKVKHSKCFLI